MKKDVFIVDKYLIKFGAFFLIVGLVTTLFDTDLYYDLNVDLDFFSIPTNYNGRTLEEIQLEYGPDAIISAAPKPIYKPLIAFNGLLLLIAGIYYRKKENKIHIIWGALEKANGAKLRDLEVSLGLNRSFILDSLDHINAQLGAYYVYLSDKDEIVDGRLVEEHALSLTCTGCGNAIDQKVSLANLEVPKCNYCGAPVPVAELSKLRNEILNQFALGDTLPEAEFDNRLFITLLIFFAPAAIVYMVYKKNFAFLTKKENMAKLVRDLKGRKV